MKPGTDNPSPSSSPGIISLVLQTSKLADQRRFYTGRLGLPVIAETADSVTLGAGATRLTFTAVATGDPFYHFAFNIPENTLGTAKESLAHRDPPIPLIKKPDGGDEYHFESWNAHAVYFLDPAGNIVEFIARHNLGNASVDAEVFDPRNMLLCGRNRARGGRCCGDRRGGEVELRPRPVRRV